MKDDNVHLTQSTAIVKHIARKHKIGVSLTETEHCRLDQGIEEIIEVRDNFINFCYGSRVEILFLNFLLYFVIYKQYSDNNLTQDLVTDHRFQAILLEKVKST